MGRDRSSLKRRAPVRRVSVSAGFLVRIFALACVAVIGSVWALVRFYTHAHAPMRVPVPPAETAWDAGEGMLPAPDLELEPQAPARSPREPR